ncbi:hypothetical protein [Marinivivus vitaminiproducens]|uniref:hypothetical protein n=1 Tax=Marinivivus vitaminiproducens TaxID=3035935 RepID=UPI0027A9CC2D|nr:hypothetical protein P4R82_04830 [Geminicoccaceae bacterium SCSIO 64248]
MARNFALYLVSPARPQHYLIWLAGGVLAVIGGFVVTLTALAAVGRLPAPPVSGTWCIDAKLEWLRAHPELSASQVVAVGSSTTWRNINFSALPSSIREAAGGTLNAAPCFLRMNQTRFFANFLVERRPEIRTILSVVAPRDFEKCDEVPAAFFDRELAASYLDGAGTASWLYFRNFRPRSLATDAYMAPQRARELVFGRLGGGPLSSLQPQYGNPFYPDQACFDEIRQLALELEARKVKLVVASFATMPGWQERFDPAGAAVAAFSKNLRQALEGTAAVFIDGATEWKVSDAAFIDPVHLQAQHAGAFTQFIWDQATQAGAGLPPLHQGALDGKMSN